MTNEIQTQVKKAADRINYDWFNNGFCNFFDKDCSYTEELELLQEHQDKYNISDEIEFLFEIHDKAREDLEDARREYGYDDFQTDYIYNGDWLEDNFGVKKLEEILESLEFKTGENHLLKLKLETDLDAKQDSAGKLKI
ncbi:hypothetical protein [Burkholderia metallica]|uniref:hypothetical protein n=1 Tax=Burkholderia metallica TaxID=488729 RepID=UPI00158E4084|nr:hypothetical protein [Burkholderia metallica]